MVILDLYFASSASVTLEYNNNNNNNNNNKFIIISSSSISISIILMFNKGGIAPNQVIARSEFEVHLQIVTE